VTVGRLATPGIRAYRVVRRYTPFATSRLHSLLQYRSAFVLTTVAAATAVTLQIFLWRAVAANAPGGRAGGYDATELTTYVLVGQMLFLLHLNRVDEEIATDIYRGDIVVSVVRPVSYPVMRFAACLPVVAVNAVLVVLPVLVLSVLVVPLAVPTGPDAALFVASAALSMVIAFGVNLLVGLAGFLTTNTWGLRNAKDAIVAFFGGQLVPVSFMPAALKAVCAALPFQGMIYSPLRLLLGRYRDAADAAMILAGQAAWAVGLLVASGFIWRRVMRRLEAFGG
jgi:ABC-2 type transport system permease protein